MQDVCVALFKNTCTEIQEPKHRNPCIKTKLNNILKRERNNSDIEPLWEFIMDPGQTEDMDESLLGSDNQSFTETYNSKTRTF